MAHQHKINNGLSNYSETQYYLNSFNKLAEEFFDRMSKSFPQEPKIKGYQTAFRTAKKYNNKKPVEMFMSNLMPFGYQIVSKDEEFFRQDKYVDHVQNLSGKMGLNHYWDNMTQENRDSIWEYMQSLYMIGMSAIGRQEELANIVKMVQTKK